MRPSYDELVQGLRYLRQFAKNTDLEFWDDLLTRAEAVGEVRYWTDRKGTFFWKLEGSIFTCRDHEEASWNESYVTQIEDFYLDSNITETTADVAEPK